MPLSSTVIVKLHSLVLSQSSIASYVTVVVPNSKAVPLAGPSIKFTSKLESHPSTATGILYTTLLSHKSTSTFTVISNGQFTKLGAVVSSILIIDVHSSSLPHASVAVNVTVNPLDKSQSKTGKLPGSVLVILTSLQSLASSALAKFNQAVII